MPRIELITQINSNNIHLVFDLIRSIDLHKISTKSSNEEAISGKTSGLISLGEYVTWRAKHFGFTQNLTSVITDYNRPIFFVDEMKKGIFKSFRHEHHLKLENDKVTIKDVFNYKSPLGFLGRLADFLFLKTYMANFLIQRNKVIKEFAETEKWKEIINL